MRVLVAAALAAMTTLGCARAAAPDKSVSQLVKELGAEIPDQRLDAAKALAKKGPEVAPALIKALKDKDWRVRRGATDALAALKEQAKDAVPALIEALKDKEPWVRDGAATALGRIGPDAEPAARPLVELLKDKDEWVRESAMTALPQVTKDKDILLQGAINAVMVPDTGWSVRRHAMGVFGRYAKDCKPAVPALVYMLEHPGEGMWMSIDRVAEILAGVGEAEKAVSLLTRLLESDDQGTRHRAATALGKLGKDAAAALPVLRTLAAQNDDERLRKAAAATVEQIEGKKPEK